MPDDPLGSLLARMARDRPASSLGLVWGWLRLCDIFPSLKTKGVMSGRNSGRGTV
jgi:hypothetical protein